MEVDESSGQTDTQIDESAGQADNELEKYEVAREAAINRLTEYVNAIDNSIGQRTEAWYKSKQTRIGGSSMATIMGISSFGGTLLSLVTDRIRPGGSFGNKFTWWGTIMEPVVEMYTERRFHCKILAENSYITGPNRTCYSPDGLTVIDRDGVPTVTLLEFKAPYSRIPDGKVPKYYVPQIKMGLELIPVCQAGLFIECVIRRCSWADFGFDSNFNKILCPKGGKDRAMACGVVLFYTNSELIEDMVAAEVGKLGGDIGGTSEDLFVSLMKYACGGDITLHYCSQFTVDVSLDDVKEDYLKREIERFGGPKNLVGFLPYKLFDMSYNWIEPTPGFLDPYYDRIRAVTDCIDYCLDPANAGRVDNMLSAFAEENLA